MPRSFDVWAMRSVAGLGLSMKEKPACDAHRESRTSGVHACGSASGCSGTVVHACGRFDENVLHMSELGNFSLRRRIAAQLIRDDRDRAISFSSSLHSTADSPST